MKIMKSRPKFNMRSNTGSQLYGDRGILNHEKLPLIN